MTTNIEDIEDDVNGMRLRISGKTGPRKILIIESIPYLTAWLSNHPDRNNAKAPLLTNFGTRGTGKRMEYFSIRKMLNELKKKTELKKKVNPHHFRHSRGTWLASRMPESPLKRYLGWTPDSKQLAVYIHLSGRDVDDAVLQLHDIPNQKSLQSTRTPMDCPRCGFKNPPDASFCSKCSLNLQVDYEEMIAENEERKSFDERMDDMEQRMLRLLFEANKKWYDELGLDFDGFCDDYYWKQDDMKKCVNKGKRYLSDGPFDILAED